MNLISAWKVFIFGETMTLPPHTYHRLQPLDSCVFGLFKKYYSEAVHSWMTTHPNETLSIYVLPELCSKAATPENVKLCFLKRGIVPFDRNIFRDHDFLCSSVSDRPDPSLVGLTSNTFSESALNHDVGRDTTVIYLSKTVGSARNRVVNVKDRSKYSPRNKKCKIFGSKNKNQKVSKPSPVSPTNQITRFFDCCVFSYSTDFWKY